LGPQFPVNSYTVGYEESPSIAFDAYGNGVVVWDEPRPGGVGAGIAAQRLLPDGSFVGPEVLVGTETAITNQLSPRVVLGRGGALRVAGEWLNRSSIVGNLPDVEARFFGPNGEPLDPLEFRVNSYTTGGDEDVALAGDGLGNFVLVWTSLTVPSVDPEFDVV